MMIGLGDDIWGKSTDTSGAPPATGLWTTSVSAPLIQSAPAPVVVYTPATGSFPMAYGGDPYSQAYSSAAFASSTPPTNTGMGPSGTPANPIASVAAVAAVGVAAWALLGGAA